MVHSHAVYLPLGALLIWCTVCVAQERAADGNLFVALLDVSLNDVTIPRLQGLPAVLLFRASGSGVHEAAVFDEHPTAEDAWEDEQLAETSAADDDGSPTSAAVGDAAARHLADALARLGGQSSGRRRGRLGVCFHMTYSACAAATAA